MTKGLASPSIFKNTSSATYFTCIYTIHSCTYTLYACTQVKMHIYVFSSPNVSDRITCTTGQQHSSWSDRGSVNGQLEVLFLFADRNQRYTKSISTKSFSGCQSPPHSGSYFLGSQRTWVPVLSGALPVLDLQLFVVLAPFKVSFSPSLDLSVLLYGLSSQPSKITISALWNLCLSLLRTLYQPYGGYWTVWTGRLSTVCSEYDLLSLAYPFWRPQRG